MSDDPYRVVGVQVEIEGGDLSPEAVMRATMRSQFAAIVEEVTPDE